MPQKLRQTTTSIRKTATNFTTTPYRERKPMLMESPTSPPKYGGRNISSNSVCPHSILQPHHSSADEALEHQSSLLSPTNYRSTHRSPMADPDAEAMERQLRLLHLNSKGKEIQPLSELAENSLLSPWNFHLAGKLLPPPTASSQAILGAARRALNIMYDGDLDLVQADEDHIVLRFKNEVDKERAFHRQPLILYNSLLVIADWDGHSSIKNLVLDDYLCWVQVHMKIPLRLTEELAKDFLKSVGNIVVIEGKRTFSFQQGKARAYVQIKSSKPLCTLAGRTTSQGQTLVASFKFEKLKSVCYSCGMLDHSLSDCPKRRSNRSRKISAAQFTEENHLWGDFIFANDWFASGTIKPRRERTQRHDQRSSGSAEECSSQTHIPETPPEMLLIDIAPFNDKVPKKKRSRMEDLSTSSKLINDTSDGSQCYDKDKTMPLPHNTPSS